MFERYTEEARRCIFWARAAALMEKSDSITPIHLLAGIQKESPGLFKKLKLAKGKMKLPAISEKALQKVQQPELSREIELDEAAKRALKVAAETAEKLGGEKVRPLHMLEGVLRSDASLRKRLEKAGVTGIHVKSALEKDRAANPRKAPSMRSGMGYDLHRLAEKRKLIIGGIEIPFEKGAVAHSDGDVLSHAICDALLGGAGLGDIGTHFPDSDPKWRGISSLVFLRQVRQDLERRHYKIRHIDAVVIIEKPKLGPHFAAMRDALAKALHVSPSQINLKAKTNEGVDAVGRGEAVAAQAIATIES
jgi:2-C-methyl-D-erythritol 2,4-cyclodiphosphate synthase